MSERLQSSLRLEINSSSDGAHGGDSTEELVVPYSIRLCLQAHISDLVGRHCFLNDLTPFKGEKLLSGHRVIYF